jgi:folylpolyglutamate synthase
VLTSVAEFENRNANDKEVKELKVQKGFANVWAATDSSAKVHITSTVQEAIELVQDFSEQQDSTTDILVTGSIHLVGGVLALLESASIPGASD